MFDNREESKFNLNLFSMLLHVDDVRLEDLFLQATVPADSSRRKFPKQSVPIPSPVTESLLYLDQRVT